MRLLSWKTMALAAAALWVGRRLTRKRYDFRGKVVVITGGSRGLGLELARRFSMEGARLALCARKPEELARAKADLEAQGAEVFTQVCDVTKKTQVLAFVQAVRAHFGGIDVLVNNAGVILVGPAATMTERDYDEAMKTHFYGPLHLMLRFLPDLKASQGRVLNVASMGGRLPVPLLLPYVASKFALVGLSSGMRAELKREGVTVTTVCPGLMRTGSAGQAEFKGKAGLEYAGFSVLASLPLVSMKSETAARQMVDACRVGRAQLTLSVPAKLASLAFANFPGLTSAVLETVSRALPGADGKETTRRKGRALESSITRSFLTLLGRKAARRNNELPPGAFSVP